MFVTATTCEINAQSAMFWADLMSHMPSWYYPVQIFRHLLLPTLCDSFSFSNFEAVLLMKKQKNEIMDCDLI